MTTKEFIKDNPKFYNDKWPLHELTLKVRKQAINHTRRVENNELYEVRRPNESKEIKEYRDKNRRNLTTEGVYRFISMVSRVFKDSGLTLDDSTGSEELNEWLESKPFWGVDKNMDVWEYLYQCVFMQMLESPNDVILPFPIIQGSTSKQYLAKEAPAISGQSNQRVYPEPKSVHVDDIRVFNEDLFCWKGGKDVIQVDGNPQSHDFFFLVDRKKYYRYSPVSKSKKEVEYRLTPWYTHNIEKVPVTYLGGRPALSEDGSKKYFESYAHPYFEYCDEFVGRFSDSQAVNTQHAYPATVVDPMPCTFNGSSQYGKCIKGKVFILKDGKHVVGSDGKPQSETCPKCDGHGHLVKPGPYDVYVKNRPVGMEKQGADTEAIKFVTPPPHILEHSYEKPWDVLRRALRTLGLELLEDAQESGVAKKFRLEPSQDLLTDIALSIKSMLEYFLYCTDRILNLKEPQDYKPPTVIIPLSFMTKDTVQLREEAETAPISEKKLALLDYIRSKYRGRHKIIRMYELYYSYTPFSVLDINEALSLEQNSIYEEFEFYRKDFGLWAFGQLIEDVDFMDREKENELFKKADELIRGRAPQITPRIDAA